MKTRFAVVLASVGGEALLLPGCAVGPNYKRPAINSPANLRNAPADPSTNTLADLQWWELHKDETLNSLIRTALTNNYDPSTDIVRGLVRLRNREGFGSARNRQCAQADDDSCV